jgi:6-phosphogluconolactonase
VGRRVIRTKNFAANAVDFIVGQAQKAIGERNEFKIALSGGNTPRPVCTRLATAEYDLRWELIRITFGDERCVPPDDPRSNFRMARETLFVSAGVPDESIARMRGELDPQIAASKYEDHLDVSAAQRGEQIYQHDLILLGLGEDGHTGSLFPDTVGLEEKQRKVIANFVPQLNSWRLTFTFPLINHARQICFLVDAKKKSHLIERVLEGEPQLPASRVKPVTGDVTWIIGD